MYNSQKINYRGSHRHIFLADVNTIFRMTQDRRCSSGEISPQSQSQQDFSLLTTQYHPLEFLSMTLDRTPSDILLPMPILGSYKRRHSPSGTRVVHITNGVRNIAVYATRILGNTRIAIDEHRNERLRNRSEHKRRIKGDKSRAMNEIQRD